MAARGSSRIFPPHGPALSLDPPVLLFDGTCPLCRASVCWVFRHERKPWLRFVPLQSRLGSVLLENHGFPPDYEGSAVLVDRGSVQLGNDAIFGALRYCRWPWRGLRALRVLPRIFREAGYRWISHHRPFLTRLTRLDPPGREPPRAAFSRFPEWQVGLAQARDAVDS